MLNPPEADSMTPSASFSYKLFFIFIKNKKSLEPKHKGLSLQKSCRFN